MFNKKWGQAVYSMPLYGLNDMDDAKIIHLYETYKHNIYMPFVQDRGY